MSLSVLAILVGLSIAACVEMLGSFLEWLQETCDGPRSGTKTHQWKRMGLIVLFTVTATLLIKGGV